MKIIGNMVGCYSPFGKTVIIADSDGNEFTGVVVDQETILTATAADIMAGKTAATDDGIVTGTHSCEN